MDLAAPAHAVEAALWERLRSSGDGAAREELLTIHLPYARVMAATLYARRFHDEVEFGDYLQYASVGLLEAMERYDPTRGVQFRTFAARRMHGAILNGLERTTEKQQQIAARQRMQAERLESVKAMAAGPPEGRSVIPNDPERLLKYVSEIGIGLAICWMLEGTTMVDNPDAGVSIPFYRSVALQELRDRLLQAIDALPTAEKTVIRGHYLQEVAFDQIAASMNLTKGRISQIHKQGLLRLRGALNEHADWELSA